ncbi:MAG: hypothetical protein LBK44_06735, partial [Spirochaetales bacterium]|jgi:hypothetical protein|nr:hypothetical protein [Spirochaetales bacterium]
LLILIISPIIYADDFFQIYDISVNELYDKPYIIELVESELSKHLGKDNDFFTGINRECFFKIYRISSNDNYYEDIYTILYREGIFSAYYDLILLTANSRSQKAVILNISELEPTEEFKPPIIIPQRQNNY